MNDEITVDLSNYKDKVGSRVLPGRYRVVVDDYEITKAASGNEMIVLWFRVQGGEFDGQTILDRLVMTENSMFRTVGFMQALGYPTPKKRLNIRVGQWVGKVLDIDVEDGEPYNGRVKSEVRGYFKASSAVAHGAGAADLSDLPPARTTTEILEGMDTESGPDDSEVDLDALDLS